MHISKRDANLLLILLGIILFVAGYFTVYNPYQKKTEALLAEIAALRPTLSELQVFEGSLDKYKAGIDELEGKIASETERYPTDVRPEDFIMYAIDMEEKIELDVTSLEFAQPVLISQFDGIKRDGEQYSVTPLAAYAYGTTANCSLSYEELKALIQLVDETPLCTKLDSVSVSFDTENGGLTGSVVLDKYFITSGSDPYVPTKVPDVDLGTDDLFGTFTVIAEPPANP
jgi:hypothetical protein